MRIRNTAALVAAGLLVLAAMPALGGDVQRQDEYDKYIDKHRTLQPLDSSLFGEQINLRDGGVVFRVTDGELLGNGPPIRITRSFKLRDSNRFVEVTGTSLTSGWMLEVPRLKTITNNTDEATDTSVLGWQVPTGTNVGKDLRCTNFGPPGDLTFGEHSVRYWEPNEWWGGYQLVDGQGNEQPLLGGSTMPGFKATTANNWRFECLPSTENGEPGEGFKGFSPDGYVYWFNHLVYTSADYLHKPAFFDHSRTDTLVRRHAMLLVTRIEDRFGNYLVYSYSGAKLIGITASDGRVLTVSSSPTKITLGGPAATRSWTYSSAGTTDTVTLPDNSTWTYNFSAFLAAPLPTAGAYNTGDCQLSTADTWGSEISGSATSPSGVTGEFKFLVRRFGRSNVYRECLNSDGDSYVSYPADWYSYALTSRKLGGAGIPQAEWKYDYSAPNANWSDCSGSCPQEVWTNVTAPDQTLQRSFFSNRYDQTENQLLREEVYSASGVLVRTVNHTYATPPVGAAPWPYAWPRFIGEDMQMRTNKARTEQLFPGIGNDTVQQGRTFSWQVASTCGTSGVGNTTGTTLCMDSFARPTKVVKASSP